MQQHARIQGGGGCRKYFTNSSKMAKIHQKKLAGNPPKTPGAVPPFKQILDPPLNSNCMWVVAALKCQLVVSLFPSSSLILHIGGAAGVANSKFEAQVSTILMVSG